MDQKLKIEHGKKRNFKESVRTNQECMRSSSSNLNRNKFGDENQVPIQMSNDYHYVTTVDSRTPLSDLSNVPIQLESHDRSFRSCKRLFNKNSILSPTITTQNVQTTSMEKAVNHSESITPLSVLTKEVFTSLPGTPEVRNSYDYNSRGYNTPVPPTSNVLGTSSPKLHNSSSKNNDISRKFGKHKSRTTNKSKVPSFSLPTDESENYRNAVKNLFGISRDYVDHGDPTFICFECNAKLRKAEAARGNPQANRVSYSLCCAYGKVVLPNQPQPPQLLLNLYRNNHPKSKNFFTNIRAYNMMFSFTSMGGKIDSSINRGRGPYVFRLQGQNCHTIGSLLPTLGSIPRFSQLYIYDTENEVSNRKNAIRSGRNDSSSKIDSIDSGIINDLKNLLDAVNPLVISYRMARDRFKENEQQVVKLRLIGRRQTDGRTYNLPTASEVVGLIIGDIDTSFDERDIIVETQSGRLQRLSELHPSYLALQYPLIFPFGQDGYRLGIKHRGVKQDSTKVRDDLTMREFFAYHIQDRVKVFSLLHNSRKLFQQFLVDGYTMVESQRLKYIRFQQKKLRCDTFQRLSSSIDQGNTSASSTGQRIILPSSFTGGSRYMRENYLDAMALVRSFGYPDLFITVTCNPKWPEIQRFLNNTDLHPQDRPEIICRLFKIKLDEMIHDFKNKHLFGQVNAVVYTVEFQKRGLPHAHICLFLASKSKIPNAEEIDSIISAEIPDPKTDPELYELVSEFMIHGPCGDKNPLCPCMVKMKCSKHFPKKFSDYTSIDSDGYPVYKRRDTGHTVMKSGIMLDNRVVVSYNNVLLRRYQAHINVEWCNQSGAIKYLFKYINKGPDRVTAAVFQSTNDGALEDNVDEIRNYFDCRYISACEAAWRILAYEIHYRTPAVERLSFHIPGEQTIVYEDDTDLCDVLNKPSVASSMFLGWMERNKVDATARELTYVDFPKAYVWHIDKREWAPRKQRMKIGRIRYVPPSAGESYYLRILLNKVKGPSSFEDIRTVNGVLYDTFKEACFALGLLDDDKEYLQAIEEASKWASASYVRSLFVMLIMSNTLSRPELVWSQTWKHLSDDILHKQRLLFENQELQLSEYQIQNLSLFEIEKVLRNNGGTLKNIVGMPYPDQEYVIASNNRLIHDELSYNNKALQEEHLKLFDTMTNEQKNVYQTVISAVEKDQGGMFFVYGYGGTGKTFIWKTLSAAFRSKGEIVLNVASSGIASLLLTGGRTAHSRFVIPININEDSFCSISPNSDLAALLKKTSLIIWDEAPMIHKHCFEALDRTLKDILRSSTPCSEAKVFGGKVVVFGGDFRQILPVIPKGSRNDIVNASLNASYLWSQCHVLKLTVNMRLEVGSEKSDLNEIKEFAEWILNVGNGTIGDPNDGEGSIEIPKDILIDESSDVVASIISFTYANLKENLSNPTYFQDRAILAPTHEVVDLVNDRLLEMMPGHETIYMSSDSICESAEISEENAALFSPDFLNSLKFSGVPNHKLCLKVGVPVMLLRNIDQPKGLCNGTRLQVVRLGKHVIEAKILTGMNIGQVTLIPRMRLSPSDKRIPFKINRRQFPIVVCFAMTINKSQGQSLSKVGLFLPRPVFTHGQLYVALSRVKSKKGLKVLICDKDGKVTNNTTNIVYKEVLQNL